MSSTRPLPVPPTGPSGTAPGGPAPLPGGAPPPVGVRVPYARLLRGPRYRWWRGLLALAIAVAGVGVLLFVSTVGVVVGAALDPAAQDLDLTTAAGTDELLATWWAFLLTNLVLAALIPLSVLAVWAAHRRHPGWLLSVTRRLRRGWLLRCAAVALVVVVVFVGGSWALDPSPWAPERHAAALLVVVLLTTPLQAAGEEFFFRGLLSQTVAAWFRRPGVGVVVAALVSALLFAAAHGSSDPWLFADRFAFGLLASYLVWRTGGLEAAIAVHAVNNAVIFVPVVLTGGLAESLTISSTSWQVLAVDVVMLAVLALVLTRLARRRGVQRWWRPTPPQPVGAASGTAPADGRGAPLWSTAPDPVESSLGTDKGNAPRSST